MSVKKIDYLKMTNTALLGVLKDILSIIAKEGLYRKQHLYITFATRHPGVDISDLLREDFEEEMTIVLQYEFWDLIIDDYGFSVSLEFEHGPETMYIPFSSITGVSDPSENFSLDFVPNFGAIKNKSHGQETAAAVPNNVISLDLFRKGK